MQTIIDSHLLAASPDTAAFPPVPGTDPGELNSAFTPSALHALLASGELGAAVLVQRGKTYGFDNALICSVAAGDTRLRAICAVDVMAGTDASAAKSLLAMPNVAGLRLMEPQKGASLDWLCGSGARAAWRQACEHAAIMDVHVFPWNRTGALPVLKRLLGEFSGLRVLIDNLGNIPLENGPPDFGVNRLVREVAEHECVTLKISAMSFARLEKAGQDLAEALAAIVRQFGADRICWGSDVLARGVSLEQALAQAKAATASLSRDQAEAVLSGNARRLFGFGA